MGFRATFVGDEIMAAMAVAPLPAVIETFTASAPEGEGDADIKVGGSTVPLTPPRSV